MKQIILLISIIALLACATEQPPEPVLGDPPKDRSYPTDAERMAETQKEISKQLAEGN